MQKWANEVGDDAYLWNNVLPFYERSTNLSVPDPSKRYLNSTVYLNSSALVPIGGPLHVSWPNFVAILYSFGNTIAKATGITVNYDGVLSGKIIGGAWVPATIDPATANRDSSQTSFLDTAMDTTSLKVYIQTMATKVLFRNKTATGVLCDAGGLGFQLTATREVIVSAGTFQSPQLLMVSGIGPKHTLQQYNITTIHDLPGVGQNMRDQPILSVSYQVDFPTASMLVNDPAYAAQAAQEYLINATGVLSANPEYLLFEKLPAYSRAMLSNSSRMDLEKFPSDWPEIEYLLQNDVAGNNSNYMTVDPADGNNYASIAAGLMATTSIGNITINSSDMHVPPVINPNWLTTQTDIEVAIQAFKRVRVLWSAIMQQTIGHEFYPGANITTDADILANIRDQLSTIYHAAGTCKMGKATDHVAVIDTHARVFGIKSLRVVDASSFPLLPPGHPQRYVGSLSLIPQADQVLVLYICWLRRLPTIFFMDSRIIKCRNLCFTWANRA
jgi:choline dehydrogenase